MRTYVYDAKRINTKSVINRDFPWLLQWYSLDDQTQVDSKPAGQPEHSSLSQCQLVAANRPKLVLWAPPPGGGDNVSQ